MLGQFHEVEFQRVEIESREMLITREASQAVEKHDEDIR
jgi:hypothetical protein